MSKYSYLGNHGTLIEAQTPKLGTLTITCPDQQSLQNFAADCFEAGAMHALTHHPRLNGFQGYDCLRVSVDGPLVGSLAGINKDTFIEQHNEIIRLTQQVQALTAANDKLTKSLADTATIAGAIIQHQ